MSSPQEDTVTKKNAKLPDFGLMFDPQPCLLAFGEVPSSDGDSFPILIIDTAHGKLAFMLDDAQLESASKILAGMVERRSNRVITPPRPQLLGPSGQPLNIPGR